MTEPLSGSPQCWRVWPWRGGTAALTALLRRRHKVAVGISWASCRHPSRGLREQQKRPGRASSWMPDASTAAHELGHNPNLRHAPFRYAQYVDPSFPYPDGSTGARGCDFRGGGRLAGPECRDLMSYCEPEWISDDTFTNALRFRLFDEHTHADTWALGRFYVFRACFPGKRTAWKSGRDADRSLIVNGH